MRRKLLPDFFFLVWPVFISITGLTQTVQPGQVFPKEYSVRQTQEYLHKINLDNWDSARYAHFSFTHMCQFFSCKTLHVAEKPFKLEDSKEFDKFWSTHRFTYRGDSLLIDEIIKVDNVSAYIIIHNGKIVYEKYPYMKENTVHSWMSVSKPMAGAIISILEEKKLLDLSQPIDNYLPELKNTAWQGTSVQDILYMQSGIAEDTTLNNGATWKEMERSLGWASRRAETPTILQYIKQMKRTEPPGNHVFYQDANLILLSLVAERVTGKKYPELIEELVWKPMGAHHHGYINVFTDTALAGTGIKSTLRDLALFGTLFTYQRAGEVISKNTIDKIVNSNKGMPFMWDFIMGGGMLKGGFGKQVLYVNPELNLVVAQFNHPQTFFTDEFTSSFYLQMIKQGWFKK